MSRRGVTARHGRFFEPPWPSVTVPTVGFTKIVVGQPNAKWSFGQPVTKWLVGGPLAKWVTGSPTTLTLPSLSREYVKVPVAATDSGTTVNPTTDVVQMAFPVAGVAPVSADWKTASWETVSGLYFARCTVGPGGTVVLVVGLYDVWVKITDNPEIPVRLAGQLQIT
jgi:hypothetical protein